MYGIVYWTGYSCQNKRQNTLFWGRKLKIFLWRGQSPLHSPFPPTPTLTPFCACSASPDICQPPVIFSQFSHWYIQKHSFNRNRTTFCSQFSSHVIKSRHCFIIGASVWEKANKKQSVTRSNCDLVHRYAVKFEISESYVYRPSRRCCLYVQRMAVLLEW